MVKDNEMDLNCIWCNLPNDIINRIFETLPIDLKVKLKVKPRRLDMVTYEHIIGKVISKPELIESTIDRRTYRRIVKKSEISSYVFDVEIYNSEHIHFIEYLNVNGYMAHLLWMEDEKYHLSGWIYGINLFPSPSIHPNGMFHRGTF